MKKNTSTYLDYQATTPLDSRVSDSMIPYYSQVFGNPHSSGHSFGWEANRAIENARLDVADLLSAGPDEIIFTSGATEANNLAILGLAHGCDRKRHKIFVSAIEHKSVLAPARHLANEGFLVELIPVDNQGGIDLNWLQDNIDEKTLLVSVMAVNNEIGTIQEISTITSICHSVGALVHIDATQAFPTMTIDTFEQDIDLLSLSAHKIYGPKGIGALYIRREYQNLIQPILWGGEQESGLRSGTLPTPLCVGFGKAASLILSDSEKDKKCIKELKIELFQKLSHQIEGLELIGPPLKNRHIGNLCLYFPGISADELIGLIQPKLAVSSGSACTSGITETSHVLSAIGLSATKSNSCLRISLGRMTTLEEIEIAAKVLISEYAKIKRLINI